MSDTYPIAPHGGTLVNLLADDAGRLAAEAANLPKVVVTERELSDLEMLATGALSPLTGFQSEEDYHGVLENMHLTGGLAWAIPVVLSVTDDDLHRVGAADAIALCPAEGADPIAVLRHVYRR
jgi:sulfate adenylyltransferase